MHTGIFEAWRAGNRNVAAILPTGGGKTVVMAKVIKDWHCGKVIAIAHRSELVDQIALALAREGIAHAVHGPKTMIRRVVSSQHRELGRSYHSPTATTIVASVDTLIARYKRNGKAPWKDGISLWVIDECHHVLKENKWGTAASLFPNAHGLGFTATPCRADGKGLGDAAHGLFHTMVIGPHGADLIRAGYLAPYRIFAPLTQMGLTKDDITATGDYSKQKLKDASMKSTIVGNVLESYQKYCPGRQALVFATDVETAGNMAKSYEDAGIEARVVSAKTDAEVRNNTVRRFRAKEIQVIVNVDIFGEGFDCPGVETIIMARPTESYNLYAQQFGRGLRIMEGKPHALILDHVGNVARHRFPDVPREWTLTGDTRNPRTKHGEDETPLRYCVECTQPFPSFLKVCPGCGAEVKRGRGSRNIEEVEGDLDELDVSHLELLQEKVRQVDTPAEEIMLRLKRAGLPNAAIFGAGKKVRIRSEAQASLREAMALWAGYIEHLKGWDLGEIRRFWWHLFKIDVLSAQALGAKEADTLRGKVQEHIKELDYEAI